MRRQRFQIGTLGVRIRGGAASRGVSRCQMDRCIFCGWTRRSAFPSVRFFAIPKEPGLKKVQWLYVIGDKEVGPRDRVCSVHFRSGRPSSDPSHEDFVPHLYLNKEPPPEVLDYLESLADPKTSGEKGDSGEGSKQKRNSSPSMGSSLADSKRGATKPSILQRKRKMKSEAPDDDENGSTVMNENGELVERSGIVYPIPAAIVESANLKPGQIVI
ncbi:hypothetical protein AAVH_31926, partial [Aphelenchoides avenae]